MSSREEFEEAWANSRADDNGTPGNKPLRSNHEPDRYRGDAVNFAWQWWQASRVGNDVYVSLVDEMVGQLEIEDRRLNDSADFIRQGKEMAALQEICQNPKLRREIIDRAKQIMGDR